ncbi:histidine phosphatase family protein [Flavilitoribacter nigricans]|uniref:histidine phosphatase family protein n=1 Tax=Flavilitoribacter nigricans TaxID=70997 RepID=UPI001F320567|nr:histidine phosphatase family protein [Flavilitoribacter nigricans]
MSTKTIYIVRHGETEFNRKGIIQGSGVNSELNETGRQQARAFYEHYRHIPFEAVLTSRLQRTHQTVRHFIDAGLPWEQFEEINEMNWGIHEGKESTPEMVEEYRSIKERWSAGEYDARIREGESAAELAARLQRFKEHLRQRPESCLLVCSHGRAMSALMSVLREEELKLMNRYIHANTGLWKTEYQQGVFQFLVENDTAHLEVTTI